MDYELSMMSASGTRDGGQTSYLVGTAFRCLYEYIYYYSSGNLSQNAEKYMLDLGITKEEIASIKANMLEDVK